MHDICADDIYLQPHSDDVCFSLGALARRRNLGVLVTVFPHSGYLALRPGLAAPTADEVTRIRIIEDETFALSTGLNMNLMPKQCASLLGHAPFDLSFLSQNAKRLEPELIDRLETLCKGTSGPTRPWLFCPSGIGGHVDHLAVFEVVRKYYGQIRQSYRIAFYEDLHYGSNRDVRKAGVRRLTNCFRKTRLRRYVFRIGDDAPAKLAHVRIYGSQFLDLPQSLAQFSAGADFPSEPHEAVWSEEEVGPLHCEPEPRAMRSLEAFRWLSSWISGVG